jgi:hypothetical protein
MDDLEWVREAARARRAREAPEQQSRDDAEAKQRAFVTAARAWWATVHEAIVRIVTAYNEEFKSVAIQVTRAQEYRDVIQLVSRGNDGASAIVGINIDRRTVSVSSHVAGRPQPVNEEWPLVQIPDGRVIPNGLSPEPAAAAQALVGEWITRLGQRS